MPQTAISCVLGAWAGAVAWSDFRSHRIPNALLLLLLVPAVLAVVVNGNGLLNMSALSSISGLLIAGLPLLPGYAMGQMGAGDVKFAACLGGLLGAGGALEMLLSTAVLLGLVSAAVLWYSGKSARQRRLPVAPLFATAFGAQLLLGRWLPLPF